MSPPKIYDATQAISAAFAAFWADAIEPAAACAPVQGGGLPSGRAGTLAIWESTPDVAENDRTIIDGWAEKLGIAGWHQWVPYSAPK